MSDRACLPSHATRILGRQHVWSNNFHDCWYHPIMWMLIDGVCLRIKIVSSRNFDFYDFIISQLLLWLLHSNNTLLYYEYYEGCVKTLNWFEVYYKFHYIQRIQKFYSSYFWEKKSQNMPNLFQFSKNTTQDIKKTFNNFRRSSENHCLRFRKR